MAIENLAVFLDQGVTTIIEGQKTLEQCLAECRDDRSELEPLFRIALALAQAPIAPSPARRARARDRLISALRHHAEQDNGMDDPLSAESFPGRHLLQTDNSSRPLHALLDNLVPFPRLRLVGHANTD